MTFTARVALAIHTITVVRFEAGSLEEALAAVGKIGDFVLDVKLEIQAPAGFTCVVDQEYILRKDAMVGVKCVQEERP